MIYRFLPAVLLATYLAAAGPALAQPSFTEDFNTNTYQQQPSDMQADWNTTSGQLRQYPFTTTLAGVADTPGNAARRIALAGRYAYVADGTAGIQVIDLANPAALVLVGSFDTPGYAHQIQVDGDFAYVADFTGGLRVLDISVPTQPVGAAFVTTSNPALGVYVDGNYAYVGVGAPGVDIVDISDPLNPNVIATVATPENSARFIKVDGDYLYIPDADNGLMILDISDPLGPYPVYGLPGLGSAYDVEIQGDLAYVASFGHGLWVADISDPTQPSLVGEIALQTSVRGLHVEGTRVFLASQGAGLLVIDASDPTGLYIAETIDTPGSAWDVRVRGEYAFVACSGAGLQSIQVTQRFTPILRGSSTWGSGGKAAIRGTTAYIPHDGGFRVVDFADPDNPVTVATFGPNWTPPSMVVAGNLLLMAMAFGGFGIVDLSHPAGSLALMGTLDTLYYVSDLAVSGNHAFLADFDTLQVIDFTDPTNPILVGSTPLPYPVSKVALQGNLLFLYGVNNELVLMDITNLTGPVLLGSYNAGAVINGLDLAGDLAYLACFDGQTRVVDFSDPYAPYLVGAQTYPGSHEAVVVMGNLMYVAVGNRVVEMDITDPLNPAPISGPGYEGNSYAHLLPMGELMMGVAAGGGAVDFLQIFQHEVDMTRRIGRSDWYSTGEDNLSKVRVTSNHTGQVDWNVQLTGDYILVDALEDTWYSAANLGPEIRWDAGLGYVPGIVSAVDDVTFEWLYEPPFIHGVSDMPDDQGGLVRLEWARSGHDFVGDDQQIVEYAVYREAANGASWDFLLSVPVLVQDRYSVIVPTLADSTVSGGANPTSFQVVALTDTPGVFFISRPDSGSSVDNLAPQMPQGIIAAYAADGVDLIWQDANEDDFCCFRIYRDTHPDFTPSTANFLQEVPVPFWTDSTVSPWYYHYQITAVDIAGNESPAGQVLSATDAPSAVPGFALFGAVPNPFNPSTQIRYTLAVVGPVQMDVYDVAGRRVRTLVDEVLPVGDHQVHWDGRDQSGQAVSSGVYFARLRSGGETQSQRMTLMK